VAAEAAVVADIPRRISAVVADILAVVADISAVVAVTLQRGPAPG